MQEEVELVREERKGETEYDKHKKPKVSASEEEEV